MDSLFRQPKEKSSYLGFSQKDTKHSKPTVFVKFEHICNSYLKSNNDFTIYITITNGSFLEKELEKEES